MLRRTKGKTVMTKLFIALGIVSIASSMACSETVAVRRPVVTETVAVPVGPVVTEKIVAAPVVTEKVVVAQPAVKEVVVAPVVPVVTEKVVVKKPVVKEVVVVH
jgi:hypothetical protein